MGSNGGFCIVTGLTRAQDPHHVVYAQHLTKRGIDPYEDPRNGVPVTRRVHERHHNRAEPIPRSALPQCALDFAEEHGLTHLIERYYPVTA